MNIVPPFKLYELVFANGVSASPYVWRTRLALAHKKLTCTSVPLGFTEIPRALGGRFKTLPVIEDQGHEVGDSWQIATYLERSYSGRPPLFCGPAEEAMVRLFDAWFGPEVMRRMMRIYVFDIFQAARPEDRAYFRESREKRLGATLEACHAERAAHLPGLREALEPLRRQLARGVFLGGAAPNYGDYIALGAFRWIASVASVPPLACGDALLPWIERGFALYEGAARDPRLHPLSG
jgi:glutathione S-transferase